MERYNMTKFDWIVIAIIFGLLAAVYFFDRWVKKNHPDL